MAWISGDLVTGMPRTWRVRSVESLAPAESYQLLTITADLHSLQLRKKCNVNLPAASVRFLQRVPAFPVSERERPETDGALAGPENLQARATPT